MNPRTHAQRRRWIAAVATLVVSPIALFAVGEPMVIEAATAARAAEGLTDSMVTVSGRQGKYDDFSKLKVTVSQTESLAYQGITISWTGGTPTGPDRYLGRDYLQIMQCWGPDPQAVDFRETCQFGMGNVPEQVDSIGLGNNSHQRLTNDKPLAADPLEKLSAGATYIPFRTVAGERTPDRGPSSGLSDHFTKYTTNEIPYARTASDGTGRVIFEAQTAAEAPSLGCGDPLPQAGGGVKGRSCWLVIVPRGSHDVAGNPVGVDVNSPLNGSPLSPTYFANRIVVPLNFQPTGAYCPLNTNERLTVGSELLAGAIASWQPALCADDGPVFGFSTAGDAEAGQYIKTPVIGAPGVAFVTDPVPRLESDPEIVHAPVALSGAVIALQIEGKVVPGAGPSVEKMRGALVRNLKLTPRLVAKLLTQSYKVDVPGGQFNEVEYVKDNPTSIRQDKEFLDLNPDFASFEPTFKPDGLMVTAGNSALARQIWEWVLADSEARAWLSGAPDDQGNGKAGMKVNKTYVPFFADDEAPETFPKADVSCRDPDRDGPQPEFCTLDLRPYVGSLLDAATQTLRGDAKVKIVWDNLAVPPAYKAAPPQPVGERFALSITDAASAARYGLAVATLRNKNGEFISPTTTSMLAGVNAMVPSAVDGVVQTNAHKAVAGAYPLTMLTYAAVNLGQPAAARADYATFLRYAATTGQAPGVGRGQLPAGYVPLPQPLRDQTAAVADLVEPDPAASPSPAPSPSSAASAPSPTTPSTSRASSSSPASVPTAGAKPIPAVPTPSVGASRSAVTEPVALTRGEPAGWMQFVLVTVLALGLLSGIAGPTMLALGYRRTRRIGSI